MPTSEAPWLEVDPETLAGAFGRQPLLFRHGLAEHPLLRRDALVPLAGELPPHWSIPYRSDIDLIQPAGAPCVDVDPATAARTIDERDIRLTLRFLERVASYKDLLDACLDPVAEAVGTREGGMRDRDASVFLASPGAVVPVHLDRHHNVLVQISGAKDLTVGAFDDPVRQQQNVERYFSSRQRNPTERPTRTQTFHLHAGDALYIPPYTFHWVQGGGDVSVAMSCGFSTAQTQRTELVHACNVKLRRLGLPAAPPGRSVYRDRVKAGAVRLRSSPGVRRVDAMLRGRSRSTSDV